MCGIAGIVKFVEGESPWRDGDFSALEKMSAALARRGPDGAGLWVDRRAGKTVGFVHRRLAIIDLPCGAQPMGNEDGRVQVVFNGEIYNHAELRRELLATGKHTFVTDHSDTEVLVHGWEEWGTELPAKLRGMFAFAVWDARSDAATGRGGDTLFLARDRMGQKPLFYATLEDGIVFGSTIGSVLAWPEVPRRVPREQLALYLRLGYVPPPQTIWRDISQVVPGGWVRLRGEVMDGGVYWGNAECGMRNAKGEIQNSKLETENANLKSQPSNPKSQIPDLKSQISEVRSQIGRAVESQLVSDVPVACFLSGGIDSSIVAALMQGAMRARGGDAIQTVSVGFVEAGFDETAYADAVAKKIGSRHTRLEVGGNQDVMGVLTMLMRESLGQPFADASILPTYQLSKAVRGISPVALSGDGADELFGGYDRYRAMALLSRYSGVVRWMPLGRSASLRAMREREKYRRLKAAAREKQPWDRYTRLLEIFTAEDVEALLGESGDLPSAEELGGNSPARMAMLRDQREYLPGDVLWKVDAASMAEGLEVRSPFMDHGVVELANSLGDEVLIRGGVGKWILREAFREELPEVVRRRGKKGFAAPVGDWFRGELRGVLEEMVLGSGSFVMQHLARSGVELLVREHMEGSRDHSLRLFALLMLEIWARDFGPVVE